MHITCIFPFKEKSSVICIFLERKNPKFLGCRVSLVRKLRGVLEHRCIPSWLCELQSQQVSQEEESCIIVTIIAAFLIYRNSSPKRHSDESNAFQHRKTKCKRIKAHSISQEMNPLMQKQKIRRKNSQLRTLNSASSGSD